MILFKSNKSSHFRTATAVAIAIFSFLSVQTFSTTITSESTLYPKILDIAKKLPSTGTLCVKEESGYRREGRFIYLKVDDRYISDLAPLLKNVHDQAPDNEIGAHITVILPFESKKLPKKIVELGETFSFEVQGLDKVVLDEKENTTWYILTVKAPDLSTLRRKYDLTALPYAEHEFHISISKQIMQRQ
ncbi:MAG: hypothetical protein FJZ57_01945 [Chlamydiae bacterium]|nr:hypothetical protein [Chlamydiota bacterium]